MIPLVDLSLPKNVKGLIKREVEKVIDSKSYILGEQLGIFEKKFARFIGAKFAIGVGNGTDAIRLALRALGISQKDKVLTVALTSPFTVIAIIEEGAIPVFCDVDERTWTIDVADIAKKIDKKTKAIIPVHLFGNPCNMIEIMKIAKIYKLKVIEDACQAHGATIANRKVGTFSDVAAFSFYPTKNLGAMGDAGAIITNNKNVADLVKLLRHGGQTKRFWHKFKGINSRLDEIQAAVLSVKLEYLEKENKKRKKLAKRYQKGLQGLPIYFQKAISGGKSAHHLFVVRTPKRDALKHFLLEKNIISDVYYPYPIYRQTLFAKYSKENLTVTEELTRELLALPFFPSLTIKQQDYVTKMVRSFFKTQI